MHRVRHGKYPQHGRAQGDLARAFAFGLLARLSLAFGCGLLPGRQLRKRQKRLHRVFITFAHNAPGPFVNAARRQGFAQHGIKIVGPRHVGVGGFDHAVAQLRQGFIHGRTFATPPGWQGRQQQVFTQQVPGQRRKKPQQSGRLQKRGTGRIGHQHIACAYGLQQARHAQRRVGTQLQRVQELVVHPLQQTMHPHQALEGFEKQGLVAHDQVIAFHQRQA